MPYIEKTVCAIATALGPAGIAIVRISGPEALSVLKRAVRGVAEFVPRHMYLVDVICDRAVIDKALAVYFPAPNSYTGEDVCEIQCHGGAYPVKQCLKAVIAAGASLAEPGEFTKRAFLNGKLRLSEAEAVMDYIGAVSEAGARVASRQLTGGLHLEIADIQSTVTDAIAELEAWNEYPEEDIVLSEELPEILNDACRRIGALLATFDAGSALHEGVEIAICGRPNVGKSSLLNAIVGTDKAIVTHIPGTTRDIVREYYSINGVPFVFLDTAGIRETEDIVERIGVERSMNALEKCDICLFVLDSSSRLDDSELELIDLEMINKCIFVLNKTDLDQRIYIDDLKQIAGDAPIVEISCANGFGLDELRRTICEAAVRDVSILEGLVVTSERHRDSLQSAFSSLEGALAAIDAGMPIDCAIVELRESWEALGLITGNAVSEDVIDRIFEKFCLGK